MRTAGRAMVRGSEISSNKGAPTNENAFTEQGDSLSYPRNYHDVLKNTETTIRLAEKVEVEEDVLDTLDWAKPLNFQDSSEKISPSKKTAEATYHIGGAVLEYNVIVPTGQYIRTANWEQVWLVKCEIWDGNKINLGRLLPVNSFFEHYLETITISSKDDLNMIVHPQPSGSKAVYMHSIMEDMSADQLRIIERDVLFDKTAGPDVHHRINADDSFTPYWHLVNRTNKFSHVLDGEESYVPDRVIQRNNLRWRNNKYVIPMRLLAPFSL